MPELADRLRREAEGEDWCEWVFGQLGPAILDLELHAAIDQAVAETVRGKLY